MSLRNKDASRPSSGAIARFAGEHTRLLIAILVIVVSIGAVGTVSMILHSSHQQTTGGQGASGIYNCGDTFAITQGSGNAGWDSTSCGFPNERGG